MSNCCTKCGVPVKSTSKLCYCSLTRPNTSTSNYYQVVPNSSMPYTWYVRKNYADAYGIREEREAEFDRWLEHLKQEVREEAAREIEAHAQKVLEADEKIEYFDGFIDAAIIARGYSK